MKYIFLVILILFISCNASATAQMPDKIIYKGKEYALHSNPMEEYFEKYPDKKPKRGIMSTALWRGYVAIFEVKDNQLLLKDIKIMVENESLKDKFSTKWESVMMEIFPNQATIKIDWITGLLIIPHGKLVNYVHMGYGSTYENYILLEISKGELQKEKKFGYKEYE